MHKGKKELSNIEEDIREIISGFEDFFNEGVNQENNSSTKDLNSPNENKEDVITIELPEENKPNIIKLVQQNKLKEEEPSTPENEKKENIKEKEALNKAKNDVAIDNKEDIDDKNEKGKYYKIDILDIKNEKKNENILSNKNNEDIIPVFIKEEKKSVEEEMIEELILGWENRSNIKTPIQSFEKSKYLYYPFNLKNSGDDFLTVDALNINRNVSNYTRKRKRSVMLYDEAIYQKRGKNRLNLFGDNGNESY